MSVIRLSILIETLVTGAMAVDVTPPVAQWSGPKAWAGGASALPPCFVLASTPPVWLPGVLLGLQLLVLYLQPLLPGT